MHRNANQGVPVELSEQVASNLSKRVVSVALFDGDYMCSYTLLTFPNIYLSIANLKDSITILCIGQTVLFACSGIPVECLGNVTRFVTSARLAKAFNDKKKDHDDLKVVLLIILFFLLHKIIVTIVYFFLLCRYRC